MDFKLSIEEIFSLISTNGDVKTYIVEGPMGSGKSSLVDMARERLGAGAYHYHTVDCTQLDVGDVTIPDVDREAEVVRHLPNVLLAGDGKKPVFLNLDEIGKAPRPVQNALLPVMLERRVGAVKLPPGSIVFGCTNLGAEGVGDLFQPHARNRVSFVRMRNATNTEWIQWAMRHNVPPVMLAWANENPKLFHSFEDYPNLSTSEQKDIFFFHPQMQQKSFVTLRSMYLASLELQDDRLKKVNNRNVTLAAIAGNIGAGAALNLNAFIELADKLPSWDTIITNPEKAPIFNESPAAIVLTVFTCASKVTQDTFDAVLKYIRRLPKEVQSMFATQLAEGRKAGWVAMNQNFTDWCRENMWVLE